MLVPHLVPVGTIVTSSELPVASMLASLHFTPLIVWMYL